MATLPRMTMRRVPAREIGRDTTMTKTLAEYRAELAGGDELMRTAISEGIEGFGIPDCAKR